MEKNEMLDGLEQMVPQRPWFTLKEVCLLKNLGYKNSCTKKHLQPNGGVPDGIIGGKKMWLRSTVIEWLVRTDEEMQEIEEMKNEKFEEKRHEEKEHRR